MFRKEQCPGIDPPHPDPFPVIDTLLSIPFSLMFNLPRLQGLISGSTLRLDLIKMATEVNPVGMGSRHSREYTSYPKLAARRDATADL